MTNGTVLRAGAHCSWTTSGQGHCDNLSKNTQTLLLKDEKKKSLNGQRCPLVYRYNKCKQQHLAQKRLFQLQQERTVNSCFQVKCCCYGDVSIHVLVLEHQRDMTDHSASFLSFIEIDTDCSNGSALHCFQLARNSKMTSSSWPWVYMKGILLKPKQYVCITFFLESDNATTEIRSVFEYTFNTTHIKLGTLSC